MAYVPGYSQGVTFDLNSAAAPVTLKVTGHSWQEKVADLITTNTGSGGIQERIAGVLDGEGTVDANTDAAAFPWDTSPGVRAGAKGTITFAVGGSTPHSVKCMILEVLSKSVVDGLVQYSFRVALDNTSGTSAYTRATE